MTNVRRPKHLQLQRVPIAAAAASSNHAMVSSASSPGPFGENLGLVGHHHHHHHLTPMSPLSSSAGPLSRTPVIRPTALINLNTCAQPPSSLTLSPSMPRASCPVAPAGATCLPTARRCTNPTTQQPKALSPSGLNDSMPSLIMPHLYVGNQEQTNRETVNKLNIKYILSLGLLPMISNASSSSSSAPTTCLVSPPPPPPVSGSPTSPTGPILMPSRNSSRDFKIRIRSNTSSASPTRQPAAAAAAMGQDSPLPHCHQHHLNQHQLQADPLYTLTSSSSATTTTTTTTTRTSKLRDENEGVKQVRSVYCKCINIADNSESSLSKFFDEAFAFIDEARRKKCNILIHCLAGISRSPTIAIAYLMRSRSLHWRDAYDLVKQCRPQIDPNLNFMGQLRIYNRSLRDAKQQQQQRLMTTTIAGCKRASNGALTMGADDQTQAIKSSKTSCGQSSNKTGLAATSPLSSPAVATTATSLGDL